MTAVRTSSVAGWADAGFVQPFLNRINTKLTFGATEYVGRSYSQRSSNTGARDSAGSAPNADNP